MIIFLGLLPGLVLSQDTQVKGISETANIYARDFEEININGHIKNASNIQTLNFPDEEKKKTFTFLIRADYFLPTEQLFKDVYEGGLKYGGEITASLWKGISIYFGASYFSKTGEMIPQGEETTINIIPIEFGVLFKFSKTKINPYIGAGLGYYSLSEESFLGKVTANNVGYFGQLGISINLIEAFVIDIKAKYNLCNVEIDEIINNIGGITIGVGIGFCF